MLILFCLILFVIGGGIIYYDPVAFLVYYGIFASSTDGYGVRNYLIGSFKPYAAMMSSLLIVALVWSLYRNKFLERKLVSITGISFLLCLWIIVATCSGVDNRSPLACLSWLEQMSPIYLIILILNKDRSNIRKWFEIYIAVQTILALGVIYLPEYGINLLQNISSIHYVNDINREFNNQVATIGSALKIFSNKYIFNQLAQFHNANDTGFFGAVSAYVFLYKYLVKDRKICWLLISAAGGVLWFNSGMKGPILGIAAGVIVSLYLRQTQRVKIASAFLGIAVFISAGPFLDTIFEGGFATWIQSSLVSRALRRQNGLLFIKEHLLFGSGASYNGLLEGYIDPHELPLRMAVLFGVPALIISVILFYIIPIYQIVFGEKRSSFSWVLYFIVVFVSITNNYTNIVLYFFVFYMAYSTFLEENRNPLEKGTVIEDCISLR